MVTASGEHQGTDAKNKHEGVLASAFFSELDLKALLLESLEPGKPP